MKTDVVCIYMNMINGVLTGAEYSLDMAYVRLNLQKTGYYSIQYINKNPIILEEYVEELFQINAAFYIFYINEYNYYVTKVLVNRLKKLDSGKTIILMGPTSKYIALNGAMEIAADIIILRNAPFVVVDILNDLDKLDSLDNIAYREGNRFLLNQLTQIDYDLDDIGLPYSQNIIPLSEIENVGMITSMGCYGKCLFCSYSLYEKSFSKHSIDNIMKELEYIKKFYPRRKVRVSFFDDCFSLTPERITEFCREVIKRNFNFEFWCCTRADLLNNEIIDYMKLSGFKSFVIGLESPSLKIHKGLGKVSPEYAENFLSHFENIFNYALDNDTNPYFSVQFGLPNEDFIDAKQTLEYIRKKGLWRNVSTCYTTIFPESRVFNRLDDYNLNVKKSPTFLPLRNIFSKYNIGNIAKGLRELKVRTLSMSTLRSNRDLFLKHFRGDYFDLNIEGAFETLEVDDVTLNNINFIGRNLRINGGLIKKESSLRLKEKYLFTDDRKHLKLQLKNYDDIIECFYRKDYYVNNIMFYQNLKDVYLIQFSNIYSDVPNVIKFIDLRNEEHRKRLFEDFRLYYHKDEFYWNAEWFIKNQCMLVGTCQFKAFRHGTIINESIYCCNKEIASVEDSIESIHKVTCEIYRKGISEKNCKDCKAYDYCPKCVSIPKTMLDDYCNTMKEYKYILLYIKLIDLFHTKGIRLEDKINCWLSLKYTNNFILETVAILEIDGLYYWVDIENNSIIVISDSSFSAAKELMKKGTDIKIQEGENLWRCIKESLVKNSL